MRFLITAIAVTITVSACATNPATGQRQLSLMSEAQEIQVGQSQDVEVRREMGVYRDTALQEYVSGIGLRLARASGQGMNRRGMRAPGVTFGEARREGDS